MKKLTLIVCIITFAIVTYFVASAGSNSREVVVKQDVLTKAPATVPSLTPTPTIAPNKSSETIAKNMQVNLEPFITPTEEDIEKIKAMPNPSIEALQRDSLAKGFKVSKEEVQNLYEQNNKDWTKTRQILEYKDYESKTLPLERVKELYDQGYELQDIEKSEQVAIKMGKNIEEVLAMRGKGFGQNVKSRRAWEDIEKELGVDNRSCAEKLGLSLETINQLKNEGYDEDKIIQIAELTRNYKKSIDTVKNEFKNGKTFKQLRDEYLSERLKDIEKDKKKPDEAEVKRERGEFIARKGLNMTEDEIQFCKKQGLEGFDIVMAKKISQVYNIPLQKVIDKKKSGKSFQDINKEYGGAK